MTDDYVAEKDQFLLTIPPFNKRSFRSKHFELCNLMHDGRKQHYYLVHNVGKVQITLSNILSSSDISTKSQGRHS